MVLYRKMMLVSRSTRYALFLVSIFYLICLLPIRFRLGMWVTILDVNLGFISFGSASTNGTRSKQTFKTDNFEDTARKKGLVCL